MFAYALLAALAAAAACFFPNIAAQIAAVFGKVVAALGMNPPVATSPAELNFGSIVPMLVLGLVCILVMRQKADREA